MNPEQEQIDNEEVTIDDSDIQSADAQNKSDESNLPSGGSGEELKNEAGDLDQSNIIDDESGPGGRSLRGNRGDPMAADKAIDQDIDDSEQALS